jgi:hypothetical protein
MKPKFKKIWSMFAVTGLIAGCASTPPVAKYAAEQPKFDLTHAFTGKTTAHGLVKGWNGNVVRRFTAEINGTFDAQGNGRLDEVFYWSDGERQTRTWELTKTGPNTFKGTAGDVVGEAQGQMAGNALNMRYTLEVPVGERTMHFAMDDWMYLLPDGTIMNTTSMRKFGIQVAEIMLLIQKKK